MKENNTKNITKGYTGDTSNIPPKPRVKKARKHTSELLQELDNEIAEDKKQHAVGFYFYADDDEITDNRVKAIYNLYDEYLTKISR